MEATAPQTIELHTGQIVPWPPAPGRFAQVDELLRRNVRVVYRTSTGRTRRPLVKPARLVELLARDAREQPLLPLTNPLRRGTLSRRKTFTIG